ncbi:MAG: hypothetical protein FWE01_00140 [Firmicutes bacterium]|nr:hypothetical protein [Bacillota bacterium]
MEKVALIEIGTSNIRLGLYLVQEGEFAHRYKQMLENTELVASIVPDGLIKSAKMKECVALLQMFKKVCEAEGVTRYIARASNGITIAKNYQTFVEEMGVAFGHEVKVLSKDDEVSALYTAVTNTIDAPKGAIVNISSQSTCIIHYNRRIVLDNTVIPFGSSNLFDAISVEGDQLVNAVEFFKKQLNEYASFLLDIDPETILVGVGETFTSYGKLARRITKYPVDIDHNYASSPEIFEKVLNFLKDLDPAKRQKLRGISENSATSILSGFCIVSAMFEFTDLKTLVVGSSFRNVGLMLQHALPQTVDRALPDLLGYSLDVIISCSGLNKRSCERLYDLAIMLFKQLKILHRLPRSYARVLRIAANLYHLDGRVNLGGQSNYGLVLNSNLLGVAHKDIILASFIASCKRWEDFNLSEWVKYKDFMTEDDMDAVRKTSVIMAIANSLNVRNQDIVKDITCDILGDSVILKLVTETDPKVINTDPNATQIEIFYAKKHAGEFNKSFKKVLEVL